MKDPGSDRVFMARALQLARRGLESVDPNPRVGCVIVRDGSIVGEGWHARAGEAHAEVRALTAAGVGARGATAYVTLEPCCHHGRTPPCSDALIAAGIARVVFASHDPNPRVNGGGARALVSAGVVVEAGVLDGEARALNPGFVLRMTQGRPLVRLKVAASLDGRTALADGRSRWITGEDARRDVQRYRARSSAILTGVGTVIADDPELNVRTQPDARQPLRVVLDSRLRTPVNARLLKGPGRALILAGTLDAGRRAALESAGATVAPVAAGNGRVDPLAAIRYLATLECNEVLVEAGPTLAGALLEAAVVDELVVYLAGRVLGADARPMAALPGAGVLTERPGWRLLEARHVGEDLRLIWVPAAPATSH